MRFLQGATEENWNLCFLLDCEEYQWNCITELIGAALELYRWRILCLSQNVQFSSACGEK